jgi:carboxylesterase
MTTQPLCLLIHGYQGTSFEMEPLAGPLMELGVPVRLVTLPGHDSRLKDFRRSFYPDWLARVEEEYRRGLDEYGAVIPMGFSLGGVLALALAERHSPLAVVGIAAPASRPRFRMSSRYFWLQAALPLLRVFIKELRQPPPKPESRAIAPWRGYEATLNPPQIHSLFKGIDQVRRNLPAVKAPLLLIHDLGDKGVAAENALRIARSVSSGRVELEFTRIHGETVTSRHTITTHRETRDLVAARVGRFVADICSIPCHQAVRAGQGAV